MSTGAACVSANLRRFYQGRHISSMLLFLLSCLLFLRCVLGLFLFLFVRSLELGHCFSPDQDCDGRMVVSLGATETRPAAGIVTP